MTILFLHKVCAPSFLKLNKLDVKVPKRRWLFSNNKMVKLMMVDQNKEMKQVNRVRFRQSRNVHQMLKHKMSKIDVQVIESKGNQQNFEFRFVSHM